MERTKKRPIVDIRILLGITGVLSVLHGIALLVPISIALIYHESNWLDFLIPGLASIGGGLLLYWKFKPEQEVRVRETMVLVSSTWLVISLVGALPFMLSGVTHSYTDAVFEAMSGYTTTGATIFGGTRADGIQNSTLVSLPKSILFWRSLTHWIGGLGIVVLYLAIIPLLGISGLQMYAAEASGPTADKLTPRVQDTAKILWFIYLTLTFSLFLLLWVHPSMDWFDAINHSFSTVATGGFSTLDSSIKGFSSAYIEWVLIVFMFAAGINFSLFYHLFKGNWRRVVDDREFRLYSAIVFGISFIAMITLVVNARYNFFDSLRHGFFTSISMITTTGFVVEDYEKWPSFSGALVFLALIIGGSAGSTAGGIKVIHLLVTLRTLKREMQTIIHPKAVIPVRLGPKVLSNQVLYAVSSFVLMYLLISIMGAFFLSIFGLDLLSAVTASLTMIGNTGPAFGQVGPTNNFAFFPDGAKWICVALMEIGRLEIFTVLVIFSRAFWKQ